MDSHLMGNQMLYIPSSSPASTPSQHSASPQTPANVAFQQQKQPQSAPFSNNISPSRHSNVSNNSPSSGSSGSSTTNTSPTSFSNLPYNPAPAQNNPSSDASTTASTKGPTKSTGSSTHHTLIPNVQHTLPSGAKEQIPPKSVIIKTDKPRPHVCATCTRSFVRLEHLKRHERSHTKEKPFQCPVCERCFARRDLLLRHRQKLHASFPLDPPKTRGGGTKKKVGNSSSSVTGGTGTGVGVVTKTSAGVTKAGTAPKVNSGAVAVVNGPNAKISPGPASTKLINTTTTSPRPLAASSTSSSSSTFATQQKIPNITNTNTRNGNPCNLYNLPFSNSLFLMQNSNATQSPASMSNSVVCFFCI